MTHRVFIAFPVSHEAKDELGRVQYELKTRNSQARATWPSPHNFHVTVSFLGEIEDSHVERVKNVLARLAANHHSFAYWLHCLGAFPNFGTPKIIVVNVAEEGRAGNLLQEQIVNELAREGIISDVKPWRPHVTIGRNRDGEGLNGLTDINIKKIVWRVDRLEILESTLTVDGPVYATLSAYSFK